MQSIHATLPTISSGGSTKTTGDENPNCTRRAAADYAGRLLSAFKQTIGSDPTSFVPNIATVFTHYPEWVVKAVCDPFRGLPSRQQWEPSIYEVRQACDAEMEPIRRQQDRDRRYLESQALCLPPPVEGPEAKARVAAAVAKLKGELTDRKVQNAAEEQDRANKRLSEMEKEVRTGTAEPLEVSPLLRAKIEAWTAEKRKPAA